MAEAEEHEMALTIPHSSKDSADAIRLSDKQDSCWFIPLVIDVGGGRKSWRHKGEKINLFFR